MNVNRSNDRKWFHTKTKEARSRHYPTETIINADDTDDLVLLANTPAQAQFLLHCLKQAAKSIGLYANLDKTEFCV